jgi:hypothetical protein
VSDDPHPPPADPPQSRRSRRLPARPYIAVDFIIAYHNPGYSIVKWSISGYDRLSTKLSRLPLRTYLRAANLAVDDAIAADDVFFSPGLCLSDEVPTIGYVRRPESGYHRRDYRIVDGQLTDPRTKTNLRPRPRRRYHTEPSDEAQDRVPRAVDEYRQALERGSRSPTADVAHALKVGRSTAARALAEAREQGPLGPALRNRAGEQH